MARKRLGELLLEAGLLTEAQLQTALKEQDQWGGKLGAILVDLKLISEEVLVQALSKQLRLPAVSLKGTQIGRDVLALVPVDVCEKYELIPLRADARFLDAAMADPTNTKAIEELQIRTKRNLRGYLAGPRDIEQAIALHYHGQQVNPSPVGTVPRGSIPPATRLSGLIPNQHRSTSEKIDPQARPPAASSDKSLSLIVELQARIAQLETTVLELQAMLIRDEDALRRVLRALIDRQIATREELLPTTSR
jgi:type IV pilus assembly protein PilB